MISLLLLLFSCHFFIGASNAAGVLAHIEVLRRATYILGLGEQDLVPPGRLPVSEWLSQNMEFAQAGAFFPDWGYNCLMEDEAAEAAHWPPFIGVALEYLLEIQPDLELSTNAQQILCFILGVASHQSTDASWHSIKMRAGLLEAMADIDFRQDYSAAHNILDVGGDTILAREFSHAGDDGFAHLSKSWVVPVEDIIAIYAKLGYSVNRFKLRSCMARGFAGLSAVRNIGSALAPRYQAQSPFMTTQLERHFLGSLSETSTSTVLCWKAVLEWSSSGVVPDRNGTWQLCEPMRTISRRGKAGPYSPDLLHDLSFGDQSPFDINHDSNVFKTVFSGLAIDYEDSIEEKLRYIATEDDLASGTTRIFSTEVPATYGQNSISSEFEGPERRSSSSYFITPSITYGEFGASVALVEDGSNCALAVGSPRDTDSSDEPSRGGTYIVPIDTTKTMDLLSQDRQMQRLQPLRGDPESLSDTTRDIKDSDFGRSIVNITLSGVSCLAVLSKRKVAIFRSLSGVTEITPFITIEDADIAAHFFSSPPVASRIYSFDMKGLTILALTSPWTGPQANGRVYLFSSKVLRRGALFLHDAELVLQPSSRERMPYTRFGSSLTFSNEHHMLYIGSAGSRRVTSYKLERNLKRAEELFHLQDPRSDLRDTGFGASGMLTVGNFLYVGAETQNNKGLAQAGCVHVFHLSPLYKKNSLRRNVPWTIKAVREIRPDVSKPFSQFGHKIALADTSGGVFITSPTYDCCGAVFYVPTLSPPVSDSGQQSTLKQLLGRASQFRAKKLKPVFEIALPVCLVGYEPDSRFGDDLVVVADHVLAVGAPFEGGLSTGHRRAGKVHVFENVVCN